jgi:hypothetical protein
MTERRSVKKSFLSRLNSAQSHKLSPVYPLTFGLRIKDPCTAFLGLRDKMMLLAGTLRSISLFTLASVCFRLGCRIVRSTTGDGYANHIHDQVWTLQSKHIMQVRFHSAFDRATLITCTPLLRCLNLPQVQPYRRRGAQHAQFLQ